MSIFGKRTNLRRDRVNLRKQFSGRNNAVLNISTEFYLMILDMVKHLLQWLYLLAFPVQHAINNHPNPTPHKVLETPIYTAENSTDKFLV
mgnify:CR=1 FL=1